jgi:Putative restriction endonuclease
MSSPMTGVPLLNPGDRLSRAEFERRYEAMPNVKKAELIEGVVYMPSPVRLGHHGDPHFSLITWLGFYRAWTPGVRGGADTTARLDAKNEYQPDGMLLIDPACGGQATISKDDYVESAPELTADVSASTASFDLHTKKGVFRRCGVREYLVWRVLDEEVDWFAARQGNQGADDFERLAADSAGTIRSEVFPGLWLNVPALIGGDMPKVLAVLQQGLATEEHTAFLQKLQQRRT